MELKDKNVTVTLERFAEPSIPLKKKEWLESRGHGFINAEKKISAGLATSTLSQLG